MICISSLRRAFSSPWRRKTPRTSSLPRRLLRNVLSRLPTRSLLKLRSVCREWRDIIDDPHFAAMHTTSGVPRILMLSDQSCGEDPRFAWDDELLVTSLPESVTEPWLYGAVCHGLLCFEDLRGATYLFNPLTRETVLLPSDLLRERAYLDSMGIWVDRQASRYKILRVSYSLGKDLAVHPIIRAEVLDQGSRSWRDIASAPPDLLVGAPVYAAGSIHWSVAGGGQIVGISSFDLAKEEFRPTPCPELRDARLVRLVDLRGAPGLIDPSLQESVDVWAMDESGLWVKKHRIPLRLPGCVYSHQFAEFLGCGGRKMVLKHRSGLLSYDPATDELEYVQRGHELPARVVGSITVSLLSPAKLWNADKVPDLVLAHHIRKRDIIKGRCDRRIGEVPISVRECL